MDVLFVHARGGVPAGVEVVRPEHDDEAVMVGAPTVGPPATHSRDTRPSGRSNSI
jgi:hypothetical protein